MPRPYPPEFRARAIALVRAGKQVKQTAYELGISAGCLHQWLKQDLIDRGEMPGKSTAESADLRAARKKIRDLATELAIIRQVAKFMGQDKPHPKGFPPRGNHPAQCAWGGGLTVWPSPGSGSTTAAEPLECPDRATTDINADRLRPRSCADSGSLG